MRPFFLFALCLLPGRVLAAEPPQEPQNTASAHVMVRAASTQWGDALPALPRGAQASVLAGDPGQPGAFAIRLKFPAGYRVPRHRHPSDEQVTVIEGDIAVSMGDGAAAHSADFGPGDYMLLPAHVPHEASTRGGAVVEIHSTGPFEISYANSADDPRRPAMP